MIQSRLALTSRRSGVSVVAATALALTGTTCAEIPALDDILDGYHPVPLAAPDGTPMWRLYVRPETRDLLAVLPRDHESRPFLFLNSLAGGYPTAGSQGGTELAYWKRIRDRLALMTPQTAFRTTGDVESRASLDLIYTDAVRFDLPIAALTADGAPVIDLDAMLFDHCETFHAFNPGFVDPALGMFGAIKLFPQNLTVEVQMPWRDVGGQTEGRLVTLAFSFAELPPDDDYEPREADARVGYFHTAHTDLGRIESDAATRRSIHRWDLRKADPALALSPPLEPIVFYIDHKTPIRFRRWVREGILAWNDAFEALGIVNAIEVYQQDARSGAHMDKRPEDVRHNFFIWNSTDWGFAQGPSRVDPRTGRILDADIVFHDGWIRSTTEVFRQTLADTASEPQNAATEAWLARHPAWRADERFARALGIAPIHQPAAAAAARHSARPTAQTSGHRGGSAHGDHCCTFATHRAVDIALARAGVLDAARGAGTATIDLEQFIGEQVRDVAMHEFGHILGLRHNFKASALYTVDELSARHGADRGKPVSASVMDYNATNFLALEHDADGACFMRTLGPYDHWAIRFGYGAADDRAAVLAESTRPEHAYLTDEDLTGPDPAASSRDLGRDAIAFVEQDLAIVRRARQELVERVLRDGASYQDLRDAVFGLLHRHRQHLRTVARHIGGLDVRRDRVGDSDRAPTEPVSAAVQRRALACLTAHAFRDDAFGFTAELLAHTTFDRWFDGVAIDFNAPDPQFEVHALVRSMQATVLTDLLLPKRLDRVLDHAQRAPAGRDVFTIAELFTHLDDAIWSELRADPAPRDLTISSVRRGAQREYLERLIDLATTPGADASPGVQEAAALAALHLDELKRRIETILAAGDPTRDRAALAHLHAVARRIDDALRIDR